MLFIGSHVALNDFFVATWRHIYNNVGFTMRESQVVQFAPNGQKDLVREIWSEAV